LQSGSELRGGAGAHRGRWNDDCALRSCEESHERRPV
jgi:hypothetical protein